MAILKNSRVIFHDTRVDLDATSIEMEVNAEGVDSATLNQDTRTFEAGLKSTLVSVSGIFNNASNEHLTSQVDLINLPITIIPENGIDAFIMNANTFGSGWGGSIGEQATFNLQAMAKTQSVKGKILANKTFTTGETEDGVQFSAIKDKLVVNVHCVSVGSRTTGGCTVHVDHSATLGFGSYTTINPSVVFFSTTSSFFEISATNDEYYRVRIEVTGDGTYEIICAAGFMSNDDDDLGHPPPPWWPPWPPLLS